MPTTSESFSRMKKASNRPLTNRWQPLVPKSPGGCGILQYGASMKCQTCG